MLIGKLNNKPQTKVFAKAALDNVISAIASNSSGSIPTFSFSILAINFNNIFSIGHLYQVGESMNSVPSLQNSTTNNLLLTKQKMNGNFYISTDKSQLDKNLITDFLSNHSYWAQGRSEQTIEKSIENSLCFGVFTSENKQVGFARVVTDYAVFAWLLDVFILEDFRGRGLGKMLMSAIITREDLQGLKRWGLGTRDAHGLYEKYGFTALSKPEIMMERVL